MSEKITGAVTAVGTSLIAEAIAKNTKMSFLKIIGSRSEYTDKQLPTMGDEVLSSASTDQTGHISNVEIKNSTTIATELVLDGTSVASDYQLNTVLVLATVDGKDHLFAALKMNQSQYMNAYDGKSSTNFQINCSFSVANSDAVSITVNSAALLTVDDYNRMIAHADSGDKLVSANAASNTSSAVAVESKARAAADESAAAVNSSAVTAESQARFKADTSEATARASADLALDTKIAANASAISKLQTSAATHTDNQVSDATSSASDALSSAMASEVTARSSAIAVETKNRSAAISAEAKARSDADVKLQNSAVANSSAAASAQAAVDGLEIGGRNYTLNSYSFGGVLPSADGKVTLAIETDPDDKIPMLHVTTQAANGIYFYPTVPHAVVLSGEFWALSAYVKGTTSLKQFGHEYGTINKFDLTEDWQRCTAAGLVTATGDTGAFVMRLKEAGEFWIKLIKTERGKIATDWSPAPEDKANDADVGHLAKDQTWAGVNNFQKLIGIQGFNIPHIPGGSDLDNYRDTGFFEQISSTDVATTANIPFGTNHSYYLQVMAGANYVTQVAWSHSEPAFAIRTYSAQSKRWSAWTSEIFLNRIADLTQNQTFTGFNTFTGGVQISGKTPATTDQLLDNSTLVHKSGNETIADTKNFTGALQSQGNPVATQLWSTGAFLQLANIAQTIAGTKNFTGALQSSGQPVATQQWAQARYDIVNKTGTTLETPSALVSSSKNQVIRTIRTPFDVGLSTTNKVNYGILTQEITNAANGGVFLSYEYGIDGIPRTYHATAATATTWSKWYLDPIIEAPIIN